MKNVCHRPATDPCHRIKLGSIASGGAAIRGSTLARNYNDGAETLRWRYAADETFWAYNDIVVVDPETNPQHAPGVTTSGLAGVMWFHAGSHVGHPGSSSSDIGTGIYTGSVTFGALGAGSRIVKTWPRNGQGSAFSLLVDGRKRLLLSANRGPQQNQRVVFSLAGEGSSFVSRRVLSRPGRFISKPWSSETKLYLPVRTGNGANAKDALITESLTGDGNPVDVSTCF